MIQQKGIEVCYCGVREQGADVIVTYDKGLQDSELLTSYQLNTQKFSAIWHLNTLFNIWCHEKNSFMLALTCFGMKWRIIKNNRGCFYVQFKNASPVSGFGVPEGYWGFRQGQVSALSLVGVIGEESLMLPQAHCLTAFQARDILNQFFFSDQEDAKLSYSPVLWEETGKYRIDLNSTSPLDRRWQDAIGYHENPDYEGWKEK